MRSAALLALAALAALAALVLVACRKPPTPEPALEPPIPYAQRVAEIHLGSPEGPVLARVYPGAEAKVARVDPGHVRVTLPAFGLSGYADEGAFGSTPRARGVMPPLTGRLVKDAPSMLLHPSPDQQGMFGSTICGDLRIVHEGPPARVVQRQGATEIFGWLDGPFDFPRGSFRCTLRVVTRTSDGRWMLGGGATEDDAEEVREVPDGFVHADVTAGDALAPRVESGGAVRWLTLSSQHTAVCREWTFGRVHEDDESVLALTPRIHLRDGDGYASFLARYTAESHGLLLFGPHFTSRPRDRPSREADLGGYRCATSYEFVGVKDGALRMFPGAAGPTVVAWHPDDEELWYTNVEACEAAAKIATLALARDPERTPPGGVHLDCFAELVP